MPILNVMSSVGIYVSQELIKLFVILQYICFFLDNSALVLIVSLPVLTVLKRYIYAKTFVEKVVAFCILIYGIYANILLMFFYPSLILIYIYWFFVLISMFNVSRKNWYTLNPRTGKPKRITLYKALTTKLMRLGFLNFICMWVFSIVGTLIGAKMFSFCLLFI